MKTVNKRRQKSGKNCDLLRSFSNSVARYCLCLFSIAGTCWGQGTMTFTFEGQPPGTLAQGGYSASGMNFGATPFGVLYLSGGSVSPFPDNGTGHLLVPENGIPNGGLTFASTPALPGPGLFNLLSFDAVQYWDSSATNFSVIGHKLMGGTVINNFTTQVSTWQTFHLDSSFLNVFRVDIYASSAWGRFSLDNVMISGVPEPSSGALVVLGIFSAVGWSRMRQKRLSQR